MSIRLIVAALLGIAASYAQQSTEAELNRLAAQIDGALGVRPGTVVADIGTGLAVQHPLRIAAKVVPGGKVVCVEVNLSAVTKISAQAEAQHLTNLLPVLGKEDDPRLAPGAYDAILVSNAYHEFTQPAAMLKHICEALKPTGALVVVESHSTAHPGESRAEQAKRHDMAPEILERELAAAGFTVEERIDPIMADSYTKDRFRYLVRAKRAEGIR